MRRVETKENTKITHPDLGIMYVLANELLYEIFSNVGDEALLLLIQVCRTFKNLIFNHHDLYLRLSAANTELRVEKLKPFSKFISKDILLRENSLILDGEHDIPSSAPDTNDIAEYLSKNSSLLTREVYEHYDVQNKLENSYRISNFCMDRFRNISNYQIGFIGGILIILFSIVIVFTIDNHAHLDNTIKIGILSLSSLIGLTCCVMPCISSLYNKKLKIHTRQSPLVHQGIFSSDSASNSSNVAEAGSILLEESSNSEYLPDDETRIDIQLSDSDSEQDEPTQLEAGLG